ncbi:MAG: ATP-binding protein, partial [Candidatus Altiarchaeota archaeon]
LTEMDGFEKKEGVVVLAATNAPWDIDPALRRAGRFSDQIFLPPPDLKGRQDIFRIHSGKLPLATDVDYPLLAYLTEGYSSADIKLICDEAAKKPWKEGVETGKKRPVTMLDFEETIAQRPSSLIPWFRQARQQIAASGEADTYPELVAMLGQYDAKPPAQPSDKGLEIIQLEKANYEAMLDELKKRFSQGGMTEEMLADLSKEYLGKIFEADAKIKVHEKRNEQAKRQ